MVDIPVFISAVSSAYPAKIRRLTPKIAKIFACGAVKIQLFSESRGESY